MKKSVLAAAAAAVAVLGSSPVGADLQRGFFPNAASTQFADVTGDGRADAIAIGDGMVTLFGTNTGDGVGIMVRPAAANGSRFSPSQAFTTDFYAGELATVFADVNGDGKADGIAVDRTGISVRRSDGTQLQPRVPWIGRQIFGGPSRLPSDSTFTFANVDGRPGVEAIAISTGISIGGFPQVFMARASDRDWAAAAVVQGQLATFFADVDNDNRADAVAINSTNITVQRQNGGFLFPLSFDPAVPFTDEPFFGNLATHVVDVDGDGRADAVAVNDTGILVRISNGSQFQMCGQIRTFLCSPDFTSEKWTSGPFTGEVGTYFAPVMQRNNLTNPAVRPVDAIAVSRSGIIVRPSLNLQFSAPVDFTSNGGLAQPFFGELNPIFVGFRRLP